MFPPDVLSLLGSPNTFSIVPNERAVGTLPREDVASPKPNVGKPPMGAPEVEVDVAPDVPQIPPPAEEVAIATGSNRDELPGAPATEDVALGTGEGSSAAGSLVDVAGSRDEDPVAKDPTSPIKEDTGSNASIPVRSTPPNPPSGTSEDERVIWEAGANNSPGEGADATLSAGWADGLKLVGTKAFAVARISPKGFGSSMNSGAAAEGLEVDVDGRNPGGGVEDCMFTPGGPIGILDPCIKRESLGGLPLPADDTVPSSVGIIDLDRSVCPSLPSSGYPNAFPSRLCGRVAGCCCPKPPE